MIAENEVQKKNINRFYYTYDVKFYFYTTRFYNYNHRPS